METETEVLIMNEKLFIEKITEYGWEEIKSTVFYKKFNDYHDCVIHIHNMGVTISTSAGIYTKSLSGIYDSIYDAYQQVLKIVFEMDAD